MSRKEQATMASERVADLLADRILSGNLKPGERIKQDELATELGISRIPVREELRILETRGMVSLQPNVGASVATLTLRDMDISNQIRELLEPHWSNQFSTYELAGNQVAMETERDQWEVP